ncbi:hypothetical protein KFE25_004851 [Diacronema lutheri]|uniref:Polymerase nucleotidyl transferase domain-containing protein n=1 Tax=Diacronema lutheri TaxID=2081491 RepID=A0A8J6CB52_DIALT|nr:hypothetical protein KFE25_004851 [Diacronema lutheri]
MDGAQLARALATLARVYGLRDAQVLNVYLVGSRLWGTQRPSFDYDLVVVVADSDSTLGGDASTGAHGHAGAFDVQVLSREGFAERVRAQELAALICCYLPPEHVWRERARVSHVLSRGMLARACLTSSDKSWARARKDCEARGQIERARKGVVHALRQRALALQLLEAGGVRDFAMAGLLGPLTVELARGAHEPRALDAPQGGGTGAGEAVGSVRDGQLFSSWEAGLPGQAFRRMGAALMLTSLQSPAGQ